MIAAAHPDHVSRPPRGIAVWHVVITGFMQTLREPTGGQQLWDEIRRAQPGPPALLLPWNADWQGVADLIWRFRPLDRPPRVYVYAYSFGGGWGFPQLARELAEREIEIEHAVLADAVFRPRWRLLAPLSLTPWPKIVAPPNVRKVSWFRQRTGLPKGHNVVAADPDRTTVYPAVLIPGVTHHFMDDDSHWWAKSLAVASQARPAEPTFKNP